MKLTNKENIHMAMAVFLANDDYDYDARPNSISATGLLKSVKQVILSKRVDTKVMEIDISAFIASSLGNAVHDGIEAAWQEGKYQRSLRKLGIAEDMIAKVKLNPLAGTLKDGDIAVYVEKRSEKEIVGYYVTGKFDFVGDGELVDHKTTGVYGFMNGSNDENHKLQGSIYRWLNQDIITSDYIIINFFFTDWSKLRSVIEEAKGYPSSRSMTKKIPLLSIADTEKFVKHKVNLLKKFMKSPEADMPDCTPEELWQAPAQYKYYKNPAKKARATRNFDNYAEANTRRIKDGGAGMIDIVAGEAKRCNYCSGVSICEQAKLLQAQGLLVLENLV
ncbi:MAG: hypothetical protein DRH06_00290 [Deltaproteobacteria bacterium]|nr:MAG: hypothetical protein DRH06_00290 [Deltaproteobacteria bacterium]